MKSRKLNIVKDKEGLIIAVNNVKLTKKQSLELQKKVLNHKINLLSRRQRQWERNKMRQESLHEARVIKASIANTKAKRAQIAEISKMLDLDEARYMSEGGDQYKPTKEKIEEYQKYMQLRVEYGADELEEEAKLEEEAEELRKELPGILRKKEISRAWDAWESADKQLKALISEEQKKTPLQTKRAKKSKGQK